MKLYFVLAVLGLMIVDCDASGGSSEEGREGDACYPNETCDEGLKCENNICVEQEEQVVTSERAPSPGFGLADVRWNGSTTVEARGYHLTMAEFAFGGSYSQLRGPTYSVPGGRISAEYMGHHHGYGAPYYDETEPEIWVALFGIGVPERGEVELGFAPFLRVTSVNGSEIEIDTQSGALESEFFNGGQVLLCHESGERSGRIVHVVTNGTGTLTIAEDVHLAPDDWILLAPRREGADVPFRYTRTLKFDVLPDQSMELRNFQFSGRDTYSYVGNPFGDLIESEYEAIDFRHHIAPLAVGVIGTIQAFRLSDDGGAASLTISHDSSNHMVAAVSVSRTGSYGDGLTVPFRAPLHRSRQELFVRVNNAQSVGRLTITGWVE
jgi:hypothetical protein